MEAMRLVSRHKNYVSRPDSNFVITAAEPAAARNHHIYLVFRVRLLRVMRAFRQTIDPDAYAGVSQKFHVAFRVLTNLGKTMKFHLFRRFTC